MLHRPSLRIPLIVCLLVLVGCSRSVPVSTVLENVSGLRPGDRVLLAEQEVGVVASVSADAEVPGLVVAFDLDPDQAARVQSNAVAYVPLDSPPSLVLINPSQPAGPVPAGGRLKGLSLLELIVWQAGDTLEAAATMADHFGAQVEDYFESEEWSRKRAEIDKELSDLAEESGRAAEVIAEELGTLFESIGRSPPQREIPQPTPESRSPEPVEAD